MKRINLFSVFLIMRVALLLVLSLTAGWIVYRTDWIYTQVIVYALLGFIVFDIFRVLQRTNKDLERFLTAMKYGDFDIVIDQKKLPQRYRQLLFQMEEIKSIYKKSSLEAEISSQLYEEVLNEQGAPFVLLDANNDLILSNPSFFKSLNSSKSRFLVDLKKVIPELSEMMNNYRGSFEHVFLNKEMEESILKVLEIKKDNQRFNLLVLSNTKGAQKDDEFEAWVTFGKVFSHEILNGITPIYSMSGSVKQLLQKVEDDSLEK